MIKKNEVILVNPPGLLAGMWHDQILPEQYMLPYSIIFLYNYLKYKGIESKIFDLFLTSPNDLIEFSKDLKSPIIGFTSQSNNRFMTIDIIRMVKKANPSSIIVVGGKHFSWTSEEALEEISEIDYVIRGEGENTFYELVISLKENKELSSVDGITYRESGKIIKNRDRQLETNIDKFSIDYMNLPMVNDFKKGTYLRNYENEKTKAFPILLGRGCSRKCVFCSFRLMKYRARSLESVLNEIVLLKEKFNQHNFNFCDPSFCERTDFVEAFCEILMKDNFNIKWFCESRVDTPIELLELMAKAGCISLDYGLESGSDKVLKAIRKDIDVSQTFKFAEACNKLGLRTLVFIIISLPEEDEQDAYKTLEMARRLSEYTQYISISVGQILPGTDMEVMAKEKGIMPHNFSWFDKKNNHNYTDLVPWNTIPLYRENLSIEFLRKIMKEFEKIKYKKYFTLKDFKRKSIDKLRIIPEQSFSKTYEDIKILYKVLKSRLT